MRLLPLVFVALCACSSLPFDPAGPEAAPDPAKPGPFPVGVKTVVLEDPSRPAPDGSPRKLVTEVWYPATEEARGKTGEKYSVEPLLTDAQRAQLAGKALPTIDTDAVADAAVDVEHGPYPLVLYSHGQSEMRWALASVTVALASHGYVVISADHPGSTLESLAHGQMDEQGQIFQDRPLDAEVLLDTFTALPASDPLAKAIDTAQVGMMGHSFGALTILRIAATDARIKAIAPMTPPSALTAWMGLGTAEKPVELSMPVMLEVSHEDSITTWDAASVPTWNALSRPRFLLDLKKGGHSTYSDFCRFASVDLPLKVDGRSVGELLANGCAGDAPSPEVARALITHFTVGFFNWALRGSEGSLALLAQDRAEALAPGAAEVTAEVRLAR